MPFYRVKSFDAVELARDIERLPAGKLAVDARPPGPDVETSNLLWSLGFRKVCMQIRLTRDLSPPLSDAPAVEISPQLDLPEETLWSHARNFCYDRFSLDPLLPREGVARLFFQWTRNSLTRGLKEVVHRGPNFCTFSMSDDGSAVIDLLSVLEPRQGIGEALVAGTLFAARERGAARLHVKTECENYPAWNLYLKTGFLPSSFTPAFHLVRVF